MDNNTSDYSDTYTSDSEYVPNKNSDIDTEENDDLIKEDKIIEEDEEDEYEDEDEEYEEDDDENNKIINSNNKRKLEFYNKIKDEDDNDGPFNKYQEELNNDNNDNNNNIMYIISSGGGSNNNNKNIIPFINKMVNNIKVNNTKKRKYDSILKKYNTKEKKFFNNLKEDDKEIIYNCENTICNDNLDNEPEPLRFKYIKLNIPNNTKSLILSKIDQLNKMMPCSGEFFKLNNWVSSVDKLPLGIYHNLPIKKTDDYSKISDFLQTVKKKIDENVYGHIEAKEQIIRILAQWISYPSANGYVIGIKGSMGVGKTKLVKEGICNALNFPFSFISLGGISDASYLKGHSFTYEGATYGKIAECLMKAKVMNPVFFFDELDKVSASYKGDEIINTLIHMTDSSQNEKFTDRYFEEIDLDLSKSLIIFTYNDENLINPILKDRMITINVDGYNLKEKIIISKDYLIVELLKQYNINNEDIIFSEEIIKYIIENTQEEEGVRNLKRNINNIISWINMIRYIPTDDLIIEYPYNVNISFVEKYIKKLNNNFTKEVQYSMYT